jgi:hypothetical protein
MVFEKKSSYSNIFPEKEQEPQPSSLEQFITERRLATTKQFDNLGFQFNTFNDFLIKYEQSKVKLFKFYRDEKEFFLPGVIYCFIAGLGASILTKGKSTGIRAGAILGSQVLGFAYHFPNTIKNVVLQKK